MKTFKVVLEDVKLPDTWAEMAYEFEFPKFREANPHLDEDKLNDEFYEKVISEIFRYGDYATLEIEFSEGMKIVGGRVVSNE